MKVTQECYSADSYFGRLDAQFLVQNFRFNVHHLPYWNDHRWAWAKRCFLNYCRFAVVATRLLLVVDDQKLRLRYKEQLSRIVRARWREPHILFTYAIKVAIHFHYAAIARALLNSEREGGALPEAGRSFSRVRRHEKAAAA